MAPRAPREVRAIFVVLIVLSVVVMFEFGNFTGIPGLLVAGFIYLGVPEYCWGRILAVASNRFQWESSISFCRDILLMVCLMASIALALLAANQHPSEAPVQNQNKCQQADCWPIL